MSLGGGGGLGVAGVVGGDGVERVDAVALVASKGGAPEDPGWFRNLQANPDAEIQVMGHRWPVRARVAEGQERERLWREMNELWPHYDEYAQKTDREIPVVILESAGPPT